MTVASPPSVSFSVTEPEFHPYERTPVTAFRLVGLLVATAVMLVPLEQSADRHFTAQFARLLARAPSWVVSGAVAACQIGFLVPAILFVLSQVVQRRWARLGRMLVASVVCVLGLLVVSQIVGHSVFPVGPRRAPGGASPAGRYGIGGPFPTAADLGVIAAWFFMDSSRWLPRWRRLGYVVLTLGVLARLGVSLTDPAAIITTLVVAGVATQAVQLALGAPNTKPRAATVGRILTDLGYRISAVERYRGFRGFTGFRVRHADGSMLYVKIVGRDSWATLLPVRLYRAARFREGPEDGPFRSVRASVEHEALCALKAHSDGVPTPRLAVVAEFPPNAMLMAFDSDAAEALSQMDPDRRPPDVLAKVWSIVATLQRNHTVHHHLNLDSLIVDEHGTVMLVEFGATSLGVTGPALSTDVAEVLAGTSARLGVEPAVRAAVAGVGVESVAATLPRLQPLALTRPTRSALHAAGCLDELRDEVQRVTGATAVPIESLERIKSSSLLTVAMAALALWTLVPQLVGVGAVWDQLVAADWWWFAAALGFSVATYLGAVVAFNGSLSERVPLVPNTGVQVATSFVGVAIPGGALAVTGRFLQKRGLDAAAAAAAIGVNTFAGVVVHLTVTALFISFAGSSGINRFHLPSAAVIGLIALGTVVVGAVGIAVPWSRAMVTTRLIPATRRSLSSVGEIARRPVKVVELFGGCLVITFGYILALEAAVSAFGVGPSFTAVAIVYLVGTIVSSVAPTPGGIGVVEATLIAGLTSAGMPSATAVAAVLLFRIVTFWLPLLPGWAAFVLLQRSGDL